MPTSWLWRFGANIGQIAYKFAKKRKAIVEANLKIVHPEYSEEQIRSLSRQVFRNSFANLASTINTGCIPSKKISSLIKITGQKEFKHLPPDKGCIFLIFHMGNWEILTRIAPFFETDKPSAAMFRPLNNSLINDYVTRSREIDGTKLFGRKRGLIQASKFLRDGGILGILGDQHSGKAGVTLPLFGKDTSVTPLPSSLAQKYDCPIIPVTVRTVAPGRWDIHFSSAITIPKELSKIEAVQRLTPIMENVMKDHCADIFWLHDRWKLKHSLKT